MSKLRLDFDVTAGGAVLDMLGAQAEAIDRLAKSQDELTRFLIQQANAAKSVATAVDQQTRSVSRAVDPWKRLADAQERHAEALKSGSADAIRVAELQLAKAEQAAARADNVLSRRANPVAHAIADMVKSSRINMRIGGINMMPLVGRAIDAGALPKDFISDIVSKFSPGSSVANPSAGGASGGHTAAVASKTTTMISAANVARAATTKVATTAATGAAASVAGGSGAAAGGLLGLATGPIGVTAMALIGLAGVAITATKSVKAMGDQAAEISYRSAGSRFALGATNGQYGRLGALSAALGIDAASEAQAFGQTIHSNPMARATAASMGINPVGGPWGDRNYADKFLRSLDILRKTNEELARSLSDRLGINPETVGRARAMGDYTWASLMRTAPRRSAFAERISADMHGEKAVSQNNWDRFRNAVGTVVNPLQSMAQKAFNTVTSPVVNYAEQVARIFEPIINPIYTGVMKGMEGVQLMIDKIMEATGTKAPGERDKATEKNTEALSALTKAINEGIYGTAAGAAGRAIPVGATTIGNAERIMYGQRMMMGGVSL